MMANDPKFPTALGTAVVIPHLDRLADTARCCRSLAAQSRPPAAIIVVDNASKTHSEAELACACPNAKIRRLETNRGFAGGVNVGIRDAMAMPEIGFVWVLNNDTVCGPDALERLVVAMLADDRVGLAGSPLLEGDAHGIRRRVPPGKKLIWPWAIPTTAPNSESPSYLSGACLLIRCAMLKEIGLFDEGFFFFFEDADLSLRAIRQGWRLAVAADATIEHRGSSTIRRMGKLQARSYRAGHVRFLRKYSPHPMAGALPPLLLRLVSDAIHLRFDSFSGTFCGWREGWRMPMA